MRRLMGRRVVSILAEGLRFDEAEDVVDCGHD